MSFNDAALGMFAVNRAQEFRTRSPGPSIAVAPNRPGKGFCECCQCMKPAPKVRVKGWKCDDCELRLKETNEAVATASPSPATQS